MSDGRGIANLVGQLHTRLKEARSTARDEASSLEEILAGAGQERDADHAAFVGEGEPDDTPAASDKRVLVTPPPEKKGEENEKRAQPGVHEPPPPTTRWRGKSLGQLNQAILDVLYEAYPAKLSAPEIADRLPARNIAPEDADKSVVNSKLYGPLYRWLEKEGETPPDWALVADESTEDAAGLDTGDQPPSRPDEPDRSSPPDELDTSRASRGEAHRSDSATNGTHTPVADSVANGKAGEACAICSEPMDDSYEWRDELMCANCYEALKDIDEL